MQDNAIKLMKNKRSTKNFVNSFRWISPAEGLILSEPPMPIWAYTEMTDNGPIFKMFMKVIYNH